MMRIISGRQYLKGIIKYINDMSKNPFDITKAVDYTDDEIYRYWVDIREDGFESLIKPQSLMPMMIVGSKGSGKTHLMKYFSYEVQKIRAKQESGGVAKGLKKDKFIGVYVRCSGFNADQFGGKGVADELWADIYAYYWELWMGERLTNILLDIQKYVNLFESYSERAFVKDVLNLFFRSPEDISNLQDLDKYFIDLQRKVEYEIQNFLFHGKKVPEVEILLSASRLSYGYPFLLRNKIDFFADTYVLYLIDELENFSEMQQQLVQTLLREKPAACTYRVGVRPYGIKTCFTLRNIEENRDNAEYEKVSLDDFLHEKMAGNKQYIKDICWRRIQNSDISIAKNRDLSDLIENRTNDETIKLVEAKKDSVSSSYMQKLKRDLQTLQVPEDRIVSILNNLTFAQDKIVERTNVVLLYKKIKSKSANLLAESIGIKKSAESYINGAHARNNHYVYLDKYKQDVIDTIAREGNVDIPYFGLDKLLELSCGNPRTMLCLLKASFNAQYFMTGKVPFEGGRVLNIDAQKMGIESTQKWFLEENRIPVRSDISLGKVIDPVKRLGNLLQSLRFSDLPPQCSINIFSLPKESLSVTARRVFEILEQYSYIISSNSRRKKNSDNRIGVYQLNTILIPKWELSLAKRGLVSLSKDEAEDVFNPMKQEDYDRMLREKKKSYSFPFTDNKFSNLEQRLF